MKTSASAARLRGDLLLLLTALIWGVAFVAQKSGGEALGPLTCNGMRSLICVAGLLTVIPVMDKLGCGRRPQTAAEHRTLWIGGGLCGLAMFAATNLQQFGLTEDDVDDISGFSREIAGVEIGVMLREGPEGGKISLRCSPKYDAAAICARLGGGGHRGAAGASVPEGLDAAKKAILQAIADSGVEL